MSSTFVYPSQLLDNDRARMQDVHTGGLNHAPSSAAAAAAAANANHHHHHLSPLTSSSSHARSNSASPNLIDTPAESLHYQSSELDDVDPLDPSYGFDFDTAEAGEPTFLDDTSAQPHALADGQSYHPLSPEQTPSLHTLSPQLPGTATAATAAGPSSLDAVLSAAEPGFPRPSPARMDGQTTFHLTPNTSGSRPSSDDGLTATAPAMPSQSPRVTVSDWERDNGGRAQDMPDAFDNRSVSPATVRGPAVSIDDGYLPTASSGISTARDEQGRWLPDADTGLRGLGPASRPSDVIPSANETALRRKVDEQNHEVDRWLSGAQRAGPPQDRHDPAEHPTGPLAEGVPDGEVAFGDQTDNVMQPGRTYFAGDGRPGPLTGDDLNLVNGSRHWDDAPAVLSISNDRHQPWTSAEAMKKFERMCQDNESIVSRAATWGTRRRSLPSIDTDVITTGNFLKKLSISRGDSRGESRRFNLRGFLVRKPSASQLLKRSRPGPDEDATSSGSSVEEKRERGNALAPPSRAMSWGKKHPMPSINTALVSMGASVASIGSTTHVRSGSMSTSPALASPKSFTLKVGGRLRSKSDLPKGGPDAPSHSNLADMWKKTGGPPVASLAKPTHAAAAAPGPPFADADDDDDYEDDDGLEDGDVKVESTKMIDGIEPDFSGFREHVLRLNPLLASTNAYLVDRIAHQQEIRYKSLLNARVQHLNHVRAGDCPCTTFCIDLGGSATLLDGRGPAADPLSARYDGSDGDTTSLEGAIAAENFPQDIPMPPTVSLPAQFECQLCYQAKKFQKPSDWTKHVHEDVQPFTCTWERCRDPKIFKRKADWVRHENEGHRRLEWWACDIEDCRHTCYRRDNFLQHLVREHKFPEPKAKTKAAIKRAGGVDPTWKKVEKCHFETPAQAQDEPCRFCDKSFPTWKKLTVHLAKHMEQISLPVLRLVAQKDLDADTIISPVQDPPPRSFAPLPAVPRDQPPAMGLLPATAQSPPVLTLPYVGHSRQPPSNFNYPMPSQAHFQTTFYTSQAHFDPQMPAAVPAGMSNMDTAAALDVPQGHPGYGTQPPYHAAGMPAIANGYMAMHSPFLSPMTPMTANPNGLGLHDPNGASMTPMTANPNGLGLHDPNGASMAPMTANPNGLGLHDLNGASMAPMSYDSLMDPTSAVSSDHQFTPQGSMSPYHHSPHQAQYYGPQ